MKGSSDVEEATEITPLKPNVDKHGEKDEQAVSIFTNPVLWVQRLSTTYSWRLLVMVVLTSHCLKGMVAGGGDEGLVGKPMEFLFGQLGVPAAQMQMLKAVAIAPWALKPVVALLSDAVPLFGYHKVPYVIITTLLSFASTLALGLSLATSVPLVVGCLFLIFLQISSVDLLLQAKQSEEVKQKSKNGPEFFQFTWLGINAAQVGSVFILGPLIHHTGPRMSYLIAAPFIALVIWPALGNFLNEKRLPVEERGLNLAMIRKHPVLVSLTLMIGVIIATLIFGTFILPQRHLTHLVVAIAGIVIASFLFFIRHEITGPIVFYFILQMLSFNVDGALFYFYTDTPEQYPAGPHFTAYFYTTGLGIATFIGFFFGFASGGELFKDWSYRGILKLTILLRVMTQLAFVPALLRWTSAWGMPETLWISSVMLLDSIAIAWMWVPKQVMSAHLTPQGVEATMLGLTAGTFNLAMILSSYCGGALLNWYGVLPSGNIGESRMFDNAWKVKVIAALAPCATLFVLPAFIPSRMQTEPLLTERPDSATYGSPFETMVLGERRQHGI